MESQCRPVSLKKVSREGRDKGALERTKKRIIA